MPSLLRLIVFLFVWASVVWADPPDGYYATAEGKASAELRQALHEIIRNHHVIPYPTSAGLDTGDALKILDQNPVDTNYVIEIYSGSNSLASALGQTGGWNREHQWPKQLWH